MTKEKTTLYSNLKVTELKNSEIEIEASISEAKLEPFKKIVLKELVADATVPGFRPGHVPESMIMEKLGEQGLLSEAAEKALQTVYPAIVVDEGLQVIGRPEVSIMKLAPGNDFEFKIKTTVVPTFTLPDYKKIANMEMAVKEDIDVTKEEIDTVLHDIRKTRTQVERAESAAAGEVGAAGPKNSEEPQKPKIDPTEEIKEEDLLPLTDEFVKNLGDFESVEQFEKQVKENLGKEKETRNKEKKRVALSEKLIDATKIETPQILIDSELQKMRAQFEEDVKRMGIEFDDYLKKIEKTEEDLMTEWQDTAKKRANLQLLMNKIAAEEKLFPEEAEIKQNIDHILEHHKEANPDNVRIYVETILTNEKVMVFLEEQGESKKKETKEDK